MTMDVSSLTPADRVSTILACLALDRRIGGVLFIDLPPATLIYLAQRLNSMMADGSREPQIAILGATNSDEDLWWLNRLAPGEGSQHLTTIPGPLIDLPDGPPRTVVIPDLPRASLAVIRAAVTLIGTDAAVADRHGQHVSWVPKTRWLAACPRGDLSRLSHHLLDRFAVRVDAADLWPVQHDPRVMRELIDSAHDYAPGFLNQHAQTWSGQTLTGQWEARNQFSAMTPEAIEMVLSTVEAAAAPVRRDLALGRVARALATLYRRDLVLEEHVRHAAAVLGLEQASSSNRVPPVSTPDQVQSPEIPHESPPKPALARPAHYGGGSTTRIAITENLQPDPDPLDELAVPSTALTRMYPEQAPDAIPEYTSLRHVWQSSAGTAPQRGTVIGTEPTRRLADAAIVPTVLEAARFQPIRRIMGLAANGELTILGSDLRRYRRAPKPNTALVLILDHTCRGGWDWHTTLAPYVRWAYIRRAALSIVELGHREAIHELQATSYRITSVLDGRLAASLNRVSGTATPLAHALDIAAQELRHHMRKGDVTAGNSWLIIVSDGRGNVTLEASQRGHVTGSVTREGIADALLAAKTIQSLPAVHKVMIIPPTLAYLREIPFELADMMGGIVTGGALQ